MPRKPKPAPFHVIKQGVIYELTPEPEGGYTISVVQLPGCISYGETVDEALSVVEDAMNGWLAVAREERLPIPAGFEERAPAGPRAARRRAS